MAYEDYHRQELLSYIKSEAAYYLKTKTAEIELAGALEDFSLSDRFDKIFCMIITDVDLATVKVEIENIILTDDRIDALVNRLRSMQEENRADERRHERGTI